MKRILLLSIAVISMMFLSACSEMVGTPIEPNENNMIIRIKNNTNFDFYGLEASILNHSPGIVNADGSKIKKGDELTFEFLKKDFELEGETEMELFILTDNNVKDDGDRVPLKRKIPLELGANKEIFYSLRGDTINNAVLERIK
ncbi:hypothetical protein [Bacillus nitroreducens]